MSRDISHWGYFDDSASAEAFAGWVGNRGYALQGVYLAPGGSATCVTFTHRGTVALHDVTHHTIAIDREPTARGGRYDGWETSVEKTAV